MYKTNVGVAAYVTAYGRLKLMEELLEPLGTRVIGHDTDSAWFLDHPMFPRIKTSTHLGCLEDEYPKHLLHSAVGTGAKCYAMRMKHLGLLLARSHSAAEQ